eukprot:TRINITY_DN928_c0_g1_i3.p1 TRINITY_DN928_c0_g1~~TRINITY_DN928_c0_g1_i3.p1  ORF type:complete len:388 (-),score=185.94 TRINITY_DN928_c0_g1_i3:77-1177(-)
MKSQIFVCLLAFFFLSATLAENSFNTFETVQEAEHQELNDNSILTDLGLSTGSLVSLSENDDIDDDEEIDEQLEEQEQVSEENNIEPAAPVIELVESKDDESSLDTHKENEAVMDMEKLPLQEVSVSDNDNAVNLEESAEEEDKADDAAETESVSADPAETDQQLKELSEQISQIESGEQDLDSSASLQVAEEHPEIASNVDEQAQNEIVPASFEELKEVEQPQAAEASLTSEHVEEQSVSSTDSAAPSAVEAEDMKEIEVAESEIQDIESKIEEEKKAEDETAQFNEQVEQEKKLEESPVSADSQIVSAPSVEEMKIEDAPLSVPEEEKKVEEEAPLAASADSTSQLTVLEVPSESDLVSAEEDA